MRKSRETIPLKGMGHKKFFVPTGIFFRNQFYDYIKPVPYTLIYLKLKVGPLSEHELSK
jgi:hypothetical protein